MVEARVYSHEADVTTTPLHESKRKNRKLMSPLSMNETFMNRRNLAERYGIRVAILCALVMIPAAFLTFPGAEYSGSTAAETMVQGPEQGRRLHADALFDFDAMYQSMNSDVDMEGAPRQQQQSDSKAKHFGRRLKEHVQRILKTKEHKPLHPLDKSDWYGLIFATLGLVVAAGGGIGGGGVLVPIYILVMGFGPKHAIPLSNITVFGGSIANSVLNASKRHPLADRPLVDWDLILIMEPLTIGGALIGAFLNKLLPEKVLVIMLVVLLSFTAYKTLTKAFKMYRRESMELAAGSSPISASYRSQSSFEKESELTKLAHSEDDRYNEQAGESLLDHVDQDDNEDEDDEDDGRAIGGGTENDNDKQPDLLHKDEEDGGGSFSPTSGKRKVVGDDLRRILAEETELPLGNIIVLLVMFAVVLVINLLKGGGAFPSPLGIRCGSTSFWVANVAMLAWIVVTSWIVRAYLVQRHHLKEKVGYQYLEGDIKWDERATIVYPIVCCLAGFFAGMFGVGGGIVKGPLMLAMGVHPAVSSASSACMILFTSFTATTSFVVFGLLVPDYAVVCLVIGFVATLVGQIGLSYLMQKYKRNSYIAFSIGAVVLLSAFLMTVQSLVSLAEGGEAPPGGICGKHER